MIVDNETIKLLTIVAVFATVRATSLLEQRWEIGKRKGKTKTNRKQETKQTGNTQKERKEMIIIFLSLARTRRSLLSCV